MRVVGYTYLDENLCPACTLKAMRANGIKVRRGKSYEEAIRLAAQDLNIDFEDQDPYDSGDFPKPVTDQKCETKLTEVDSEAGVRLAIPDERCTRGKCGKWLVLGEKSPTEGGLTRWVRDEYELPQALARDIAGKLREWGLSHPEFITEDDIREAAVLFPHDYVTVCNALQGIKLRRTPEYDEAPCFYCSKPWERQIFICEVCGANVPADFKHAHEIQVRGQIKFREIKPKRRA
ncbi:hypothetical protein [Streptomyces sp. NPDC055036]